jgi:hypothetical protein
MAGFPPARLYLRCVTGWLQAGKNKVNGQGREWRPRLNPFLGLAVAQPIYEHLLLGLIARTQQVPNGVPSGKVANLLGQVLHVVASPFQRLRHEQYLHPFRACHAIVVVHVADVHQVAQPIDDGVCAEDADDGRENAA